MSQQMEAVVEPETNQVRGQIENKHDSNNVKLQRKSGFFKLQSSTEWAEQNTVRLTFDLFFKH